MGTNSGSSRPTVRNLLAQVELSELKLLRVAIRRRDIQASGPTLPLERDIDDPARIVPFVHVMRDEKKGPRIPVFSSDIKVNQEFRTTLGRDKRFVLSDANVLEEQIAERSRSYSRSKSRSCEKRRSRSPRRSRSRSPKGSRNRARERSRSRDPYAKDKYRSRRSRSASPKTDRSAREKDAYRKTSRPPTPLRPGEYRPNHPDLKLRNSRKSQSKDRDYDRYRPTSKPTSKRSPSPYKTGRRYSRSPSRAKSPSYKEKRSSPARYASGSRTSRGRSRTPKYDREDRRSRSPHKSQGRKGSPPEKRYRRSRTPPRYERRRSRSPYYRKSPHRSHYYRGSSRSPNRKRIKNPQGYGEQLIPPEYAFYDPFWIPPGAMRPFGPIPRYYQPGIRPGSFFLQPRMPFPVYPRPMHQFNSNVVRSPVVSSSVPSATVTKPDEVGEASTSTVTFKDVTEEKDEKKEEDKDKETTKKTDIVEQPSEKDKEGS